MQRQENIRIKEEMSKALDERRRKLEDEIELEKKKVQRDYIEPPVNTPTKSMAATGTKFENRLHYRGASLTPLKNASNRKTMISMESVVREVDASREVNTIVIPKDNNNNENNENNDNNDSIIIISKK